MSGLSALRRSGRFMVMVSKPRSRFCRTMSLFMSVFLGCYYSLCFGTVIASQRVGAKRRPMTGSAKQSMAAKERKMDCFVASAPVRKRFAFVAGNDGLWLSFLHQRAARRFQRLERLIAGNRRQQLVVVPAAFRLRRLLDLEQIHVVHHAAVLANPAIFCEHVVDRSILHDLHDRRSI